MQGELAKRGIIDVLRNGINIYPVDLIMFYLTPTEGNDKTKDLFEKNIFSVIRQIHYSIDAGKLALDMCLFINGLPVITFELLVQPCVVAHLHDLGLEILHRRVGAAMFHPCFGVGGTVHIWKQRHIRDPQAVDHNVDVDVAAAIVSVWMCADERLMA